MDTEILNERLSGIENEINEMLIEMGTLEDHVKEEFWNESHDAFNTKLNELVTNNLDRSFKNVFEIYEDYQNYLDDTKQLYKEFKILIGKK